MKMRVPIGITIKIQNVFKNLVPISSVTFVMIGSAGPKLKIKNTKINILKITDSKVVNKIIER